MVVFSYLLEKLFENRRYTDSFLSTFDAFDANEQMLDSDAFCASLHRIHEDSSRPLVVFYPDFDMDGIMSGVVGFAGLAELGFNVVLYVPDPSDGYGFDAALIDKVMAAYPDAKVLITADTGVTCVDGVARAKELGLEVLVTDHHKPGGILPDANVVVDPMRQDDPYTMPYVCGANVIYMLLQQYAAMYCSNETKSQIQRLRVFAGIGTISDSMTLLYVNRELVRNAVSICRLVYADGQEYVGKPLGHPAEGTCHGIGDPLLIQDLGQLVNDDGIVHAQREPRLPVDGPGGVDADDLAVLVHQGAAGVPRRDGHVHLKRLIGGPYGGHPVADDPLGDGHVIQVIGGEVLPAGGIPGIAQSISRLAHFDRIRLPQGQGNALRGGGGQL